VAQARPETPGHSRLDEADDAKKLERTANKGACRIAHSNPSTARPM
jgi:hypothetical protein